MTLAKTIMIQGTASNVGKSVMAAAFCRMLYREGYAVAPFKAQNMSNNSFVTADGGEIGRAQAVQAEACFLKPTVEMNPILLKPDTDMKAQVVAMGRPTTKIKSIGHPQYQRRFKPVVEDALHSLREQYDIVVIEGAGSPAEMNLKERDIVNMSIAKAAKSSVILVGDIDWGGIFAQLIGTYELLDRDEQKLVQAFLINKFRGDKKILNPGLKWIEEKTRKSVLGVIPYVSDLEIAEEDSIGGDSSSMLSGLRANVCLDAISGKGRDRRNVSVQNDQLLVDVLWLPRISNFTDFDALQKEPDVVLRYLHEPDRHTLPDLVILPGTKSTMADLRFLRKTGLADYVMRCAGLGIPILGICGGYQMLGEKIQDEVQAESRSVSVHGFGLLPARTTFDRSKTVTKIKAEHVLSGHTLSGYEIHMGKTTTTRKVKAFSKIVEREGTTCKASEDGMMLELKSAHGKQTWIAGTYLHGVFDEPDFRRNFLNRLRETAGLRTRKRLKRAPQMDALDRLANIVKKNINQKMLQSIIGCKK